MWWVTTKRQYIKWWYVRYRSQMQTAKALLMTFWDGILCGILCIIYEQLSYSLGVSTGLNLRVSYLRGIYICANTRVSIIHAVCSQSSRLSSHLLVCIPKEAFVIANPILPMVYSVGVGAVYEWPKKGLLFSLCQHIDAKLRICLITLLGLKKSWTIDRDHFHHCS